MRKNHSTKIGICVTLMLIVGTTANYIGTDNMKDTYFDVSKNDSESKTQRKNKNSDISTSNFENENDDKNYTSNIIAYDYLNNKLKEEYFNPYSYYKRSPIVEEDDDDDDDGKIPYIPIVNPGHIVQTNTTNICYKDEPDIDTLSNLIIGFDYGWVYEEDIENKPYIQTCIMLATYKDVNIGDGQTKSLVTYGTGFMAGPNVVVGAAHTIFCDPYENSRKNGEEGEILLPSEIRVYFAASLEELDYSEYNITYKYTAGVNAAYIAKNCYNTQNEDEDWCVLELDDNIGNSVGYFELIEAHSATREAAYTCGYRRYSVNANMFYSYGKITKTNGNLYILNMSIISGQSGSPIIIEEDGEKKVCGIITKNSSLYLCRGGTGVMCYTLFYRFVDSFNNSRL